MRDPGGQAGRKAGSWRVSGSVCSRQGSLLLQPGKSSSWWIPASCAPLPACLYLCAQDDRESPLRPAGLAPEDFTLAEGEKKPSGEPLSRARVSGMACEIMPLQR